MLAKPKTRRAANAAHVGRDRRPEAGAGSTEGAVGLTGAIDEWQARQQRDADIARRARAALSDRLGYVADALDLRVCDGIAVLDGVLESGNQKSVAGETVSKLAGVQSVVNHIRIVPPSRLAMRTLHL